MADAASSDEAQRSSGAGSQHDPCGDGAASLTPEQQPHQEHAQQQLQQHQDAVDGFRRMFSGAAQRGAVPGVAAQQAYPHLLVLDMEATCNEARTHSPVEIIEISCAVVDTRNMRVGPTFQRYVRPTEHPTLDPFCLQLTNITQEQVDRAPALPQALQHLEAWLIQQGLLEVDTVAAPSPAAASFTFVPVTWTSWDLKVCLETECGWRGCRRPPYLRQWVDLKRLYQEKYKRNGNLRSCVEAAGLEWQGRAHSGLDDALNTARLALKLMQSGVKLRVTERFQHDNPGASSSSRQGGPPKQALLAPKKEPQLYDAQGKWSGLCKCGVRASSRVTKKPGANHGRAFFSCGRWRIIAQQRQCDFFVWQDDMPTKR